MDNVLSNIFDRSIIPTDNVLQQYKQNPLVFSGLVGNKAFTSIKLIHFWLFFYSFVRFLRI